MTDSLSAFKDRIALISDLRGTSTLLAWDREVMMPPGGTPGRTDQIGTLQTLAHRYLTDDAMGRLLDDVEPLLDTLDPDSDDARLIHFTRRQYDLTRRMPEALVRRRTKAIAEGLAAWNKARAARDFNLLAPALEEIVAVTIETAELLAETDNPYDALLDRFEPGMTYDLIDGVFSGLKPELITLINEIKDSGTVVDAGAAMRRVSKDVQYPFHKFVTASLGYRYNNGRLDVSAHPFTNSSSSFDSRITTRYFEDNPISGLMSSIHEAGHGMHRQNLAPSLYRTLFANSPAQAIAETISRLYENNLGRSRAFWGYMYPKLQAAYSPAYDDVAPDDFYRALNVVQPSLIRVEADEVTYGLHIILRFELENDLINGRVAVKDLPEVWNTRMTEYLGVTPPDDAQGVMQDIHWPMALIGYFPDYLLGSIWAVQVWNAMDASLGGVNDLISRGEFTPILDWLRESILQHGVKYTLPELSGRVVGGPLAWQPYMAYLRGKYAEVYGL